MTHTLTLESDFLTDAYTAHCSCGWFFTVDPYKGRDPMKAASEAWVIHVDVQREAEAP